jgi:hypothetical protein
MPNPGQSSDQTQADRIVELEARVRRLETLVAHLALASAARTAPEPPPPSPPGGAASSEQSMAKTQPLSRIVPAASLFKRLMALTQPLSQLVPAAPLFDRAMASTQPSSQVAPAAPPLSGGQQESIGSILDRMLENLGSAAPAPAIDSSRTDSDTARMEVQPLITRAAIEEQYPSILQKVIATWRTPEARGYLRNLIVDDRGDRNGFAPEVMSELLLLSAILEESVPREGRGAWTGVSEPPRIQARRSGGPL